MSKYIVGLTFNGLSTLSVAGQGFFVYFENNTDQNAIISDSNGWPGPHCMNVLMPTFTLKGHSSQRQYIEASASASGGSIDKAAEDISVRLDDGTSDIFRFVYTTRFPTASDFLHGYSYVHNAIGHSSSFAGGDYWGWSVGFEKSTTDWIRILMLKYNHGHDQNDMFVSIIDKDAELPTDIADNYTGTTFYNSYKAHCNIHSYRNSILKAACLDKILNTDQWNLVETSLDTALCAERSKVGVTASGGQLYCVTPKTIPVLVTDLFTKSCRVNNSSISGIMSAACYHDPENINSGLISSTLDYKNTCAVDSKVDVRKWGDNQDGGAGTIYCATSKTNAKVAQTKSIQSHIFRTWVLPW